MERRKHVGPGTLRERGWSDSMIRDFLGEPDAWARNPYYRKAPPMRLYALDRVEAVECTPKWIERRDAAAKRSARGKEVAERRARELREAVLADVRLETPSFEELERLTLLAREELLGEPVSPNAATRRRWMVNFARHELSNYDEVRARYSRFPGVQDAAEAVREVVLDRIAEAWPQLRHAANAARRSRARDAAPASCHSASCPRLPDRV